MQLSNHELKALGQALSYAIVNAITEAETAEFAMLNVKVETEILKNNKAEEALQQQIKLGCPFRYCDSDPKCEGKCKYS